jgi:tRNA(Ile)-lysidine synthase
MPKLKKAVARLENYIRDRKLFSAGAKLLLCCSGGSDSVALLLLFSELRSLMQVTLLAVHVNHQLRGAESDADSELVKELCMKLNIPLIVRKIKIGEGGDLENRARNKRIEVYAHLMELYRLDYIVTGHHNDDQTETMLMNLFRGAGLTGLAGIKPKSGKTVHPLLCFTKRELLEILQEEQIAWREDRSNQDQGFRRNWMRHTLIPMLEKEINPQLGEKLGWQAQIFQEAEELVRLRITPMLKKVIKLQTPEKITLSLPILLKYSNLEQYYILKEVANLLTGKQKDFFQHNFRDIQDLTGSQGSKQIQIGSNLTVSKEYEELSIALFSPETEAPEPYTVEEDRSRAVYGGFRFSFKYLKVLPHDRDEDEYNVYLDADKIGYPFVIRCRRPGDRFQGVGMPGLQKLKEYFINAKVSKYLRDQVPVFDDGTKIFWIAGHRIDARVMIDDNTTRFLHITTELLHEQPMRAANRIKKTGESDEPDEL